MQKKVIALLIGSLLVSGTGWTAPKGRAHKEGTNKEESIGLGSGAAIGAIAGGPVGLILGAAFGGWFGDRFHHEKAERVAAEQRATEAQLTADTAERRAGRNQREVERVSAQLSSERSAHREDLQQALSVEVFFRTEDATLDGATADRLAKLGGMLAPMDGTVIHLEGFADARGTENYNAQLSATRATAVRDALIRGGMPAERIVVTAEGESTATATDTDGMALERRVRLDVVDMGDAGRVARETHD
jgi:outer membrane protein OmpA-like peptidoglycan-associated protein